MSVAAAALFDSAFLAKLEQLHLLAKKLFRGEHRAERRSRQTGSSLEFADYREYTPGDELRSIDWPAYGRLERLFVKLYEQEQDLPVHFLVDVSASMKWTPPSTAARLTKLESSLRITAALAYIALANLDRVNIHYFASSLLGELGISRGKAHFHTILDFLRKVPAPDGPTQLLPCVRAFTQRVKRRGLVFVLSDFFDPVGYEEALSILRHSQFEVQTIQILDPAELSPAHVGDLTLLETETDKSIDLTVSENLIRRYCDEIATFNRSLENFCLQRAIAHARVTTDVPFEDIVLRILRDGMMLQ